MVSAIDFDPYPAQSSPGPLSSLPAGSPNVLPKMIGLDNKQGAGFWVSWLLVLGGMPWVLISPCRAAEAKDPNPGAMGTRVQLVRDAPLLAIPNSDGPVLVTLRKGEILPSFRKRVVTPAKRQGHSNGWVVVVAPPGTKVWISLDSLNLATGTTKGPRSDLRAGPGNQYEIVGHVGRGYSVDLAGRLGKWVRMEAPVASVVGFVDIAAVVPFAGMPPAQVASAGETAGPSQVTQDPSTSRGTPTALVAKAPASIPLAPLASSPPQVPVQPVPRTDETEKLASALVVRAEIVSQNAAEVASGSPLGRTRATEAMSSSSSLPNASARLMTPQIAALKDIAPQAVPHDRREGRDRNAGSPVQPAPGNPSLGTVRPDAAALRPAIANAQANPQTPVPTAVATSREVPSKPRPVEAKAQAGSVKSKSRTVGSLAKAEPATRRRELPSMGAREPQRSPSVGNPSTTRTVPKPVPGGRSVIREGRVVRGMGWLGRGGFELVSVWEGEGSLGFLVPADASVALQHWRGRKVRLEGEESFVGDRGKSVMIRVLRIEAVP